MFSHQQIERVFRITTGNYAINGVDVYVHMYYCIYICSVKCRKNNNNNNASNRSKIKLKKKTQQQNNNNNKQQRRQVAK